MPWLVVVSLKSTRLEDDDDKEEESDSYDDDPPPRVVGNSLKEREKKSTRKTCRSVQYLAKNVLFGGADQKQWPLFDGTYIWL